MPSDIILNCGKCCITFIRFRIEGMKKLMELGIRIESSNRHLHLTEEHVDILFGKGYKLTPAKSLANDEAFASKETITLVGPKGKMPGLRIISPLRKRTQVELLRADCFKLGINPPLRDSGDLDNSGTITLEGPNGSLEVENCVIVAMRHIHMGTETANKLNLKDDQKVEVFVPGERSVTFNDVTIHTIDNENLKDWVVMHIDQEEANAAGLGAAGDGTMKW